ncbi:MAG: type II toxin-antitoxin system HicB family antitoxin [Phototrophicaceae bacterium]
MTTQTPVTPAKTVEDYLVLPYPITVIRDEDGSWFAKVPLLPGCMTCAETWLDLHDMIEDAMRLWISTALEDGDFIPEPNGETSA